jgi:hypothetical protein
MDYGPFALHTPTKETLKVSSTGSLVAFYYFQGFRFSISREKG